MLDCRKVVPVHDMKTCGLDRAVAPFVLNLGPVWMWDVISTLLLLFLRRECFRDPVVKRVGGPQGWF
jgi:hypothetical protein